MGGVAYLSLEDNEVSLAFLQCILSYSTIIGTLHGWNQIPRDAAYEEIPGHGATFGRRKDSGSTGPFIRHSQVNFSVTVNIYNLFLNAVLATNPRRFSSLTRLMLHSITLMLPRLQTTSGGEHRMTFSSW